jgi:hypothetical protein
MDLSKSLVIHFQVSYLSGSFYISPEKLEILKVFTSPEHDDQRLRRHGIFSKVRVTLCNGALL